MVTIHNSGVRPVHVVGHIPYVFATADLSVSPFLVASWCCWSLVDNHYPVSPMYTLGQSLHGIEYTIPNRFCGGLWSLG